MKPHILVAIFCLIPLFSHGQVFVGNVNINDNDTINVIEVLVDRRGSRKSIEVFVDFGQKDNSNSNSVGVKSDDLLITNPQNKKKVTFRSTAAVLNFLENNNWEHYNSFSMTSGSSPEFYYYFRKKRAK